LHRGEIWTVDIPRRYQEFGYPEKGGERSFNFAKHEILICEKEIRTIGLQGLWTIYQVSETHKFGFREDNQVGFMKHEITKRSRDWPTVIENGHIVEGE
jgi:hypothetical protein